MKTAILGAGAWGTALAVALAGRQGVRLWARDAAQAKSIDAARRNQRYLPEIVLPPQLRVTGDIDEALAGAQLVILAAPVAGLRPLAEALHLRNLRAPMLRLCKGFEEGTGLLPHQIMEEVFNGTFPACGALSGPSFALEVAQGLPCALTLAARDVEFARSTAASLHGGRLRIYYTGDLAGVEIGGAVKNVLAIAVGISDGMGLGQNARAALVTRGLAEIQRLGVALGASAETIMGLTGAGDLILTATGTLSRNRQVGLQLAQGRPLEAILGALGHVAEGVRSAREALRLAERNAVEMPITRAVSAVLDGAISPAAALDMLLSRDPRSEGQHSKVNG
jgi:glycerol-3-phosphate dehydrogenase (NAD(P)+)